MGKAEVRVDVLQQYWYEPVCVKTGQPAEKWVKQIFTYVPMWVYLFLIGGVIPLIIVYMLVRKQVTVYFPTTKAIQTTRTRLAIATGLSLVVGIGCLFAGIVDGTWALIGAGLIVASIVLGMVRSLRFWISGTMDKEVTLVKLNRLHDEFIRRVTSPQIPETPPPPSIPPPP